MTGSGGTSDSGGAESPSLLFGPDAGWMISASAIEALRGFGRVLERQADEKGAVGEATWSSSRKAGAAEA